MTDKSTTEQEETNQAIDADVREILGPHGAIEAFYEPGESTWIAFDGAVKILGVDMLVDSEHRQSLLRTIAAAYVAGRESAGRAA